VSGRLPRIPPAIFAPPGTVAALSVYDTAGNGSTGQTQFVGNVTMSFPDGQGCVP